jgi:energy-coupling factor transport system permease protein
MNSEWDYLSRVTIGQYVPRLSFLHRMDARLRILLFLFLILGVTIAHSLVMVVVAVAGVLAALLLSRIPLRYVLKGLLPPLPLILILAVIRIALNAGPDPAPVLLRIGNWGLSWRDLGLGLNLIVRFADLIILLGLGSACISTSELIKGLRALLQPLEKLHLPVMDAVMVVQVTLRFIPLLALNAERIAKAQASRGAAWGKNSGGILSRARQILPLLIPLFVNGLKKAELMALAMDARGYRSWGRSPATTFKKIQPLDLLAVLVASSVPVLAILF